MFFATCLNDEMIGFTSMNIVASSEYEIGYGYTNKSHGHGYTQRRLVFSKMKVATIFILKVEIFSRI